MAQVTKKKVVNKVKAKSNEAIKSQVEEWIALEAKVKAAEAKLKPHKDKLAKLRGALDEHVDLITTPEGETTVEGFDHGLEFSPKGKATDVTDMKGAAKMLEGVKKGLVMDLVKLGIGDLRKYLTPEQVEEVTKEEYRNARRIKVIEL